MCSKIIWTPTSMSLALSVKIQTINLDFQIWSARTVRGRLMNTSVLDSFTAVNARGLCLATEITWISVFFPFFIYFFFRSCQVKGPIPSE